jgi:hypothetical protein
MSDKLLEIVCMNRDELKEFIFNSNNPELLRLMNNRSQGMERTILDNWDTPNLREIAFLIERGLFHR